MAEMLSLLDEIIASQKEVLSSELAEGSEKLILAQHQALVAGAIALLIAIVMGLWLHQKIAAPILRLTDVSNKISNGNFEVKAIAESNDEIGFLANTFNQMIEYLRRVHVELAEYSYTLQEHSLELAKAKETAETANDAKSAFLANMSHELRTPLNVILGFSQVMFRDKNTSPQQQETLTIINRSGEHLLSLINDVLEVTKIEAGKTSLNLNSFDLYFLLDSLAEMLSFNAQEKGLELVFERSPEVPNYIESDQGKVRQILINLINNAIKFTSEGEVRLVVSTDYNFNSNSHLLRFAVIDTGVGIAETEMKNVFDPFAQTESGIKSQQGTGLGLSISRKFAHLLGGEINVKSELAVGSTFSFTLPVKSVSLVDNLPNSVRKAIALTPGQPQYRILVVDDLKENCLLIDNLLTGMGFAVKEAANGKEAIELWTDWQPHVILMDIHMPVMNGIDATKAIKAKAQDRPIPIIAFTASVFVESKKAILDAGLDDFLSKPIKDDLLFDKIAQFIPVTYIYEEIDPVANGLIKSKQNLKLENLSFMPIPWHKQVNLAASKLDEDLLLELITQIPDEYSDKSLALKNKVENLDFDLILQLTQ